MSQLDSAMIRSLTESVCEIAKSGLWKCYPDKDDKLPFSRIEDKNKLIKSAGKSIRYALISQIGISRWLRIQSDDRASLPDIWPRILASVDNINHIGDFALLLWAAAESNRDDCDKFTKMIIQHWPAKQQSCNAVELGWVVQSLVCLSERVELSADTLMVLKTAHDKLFALYNPASRLFARHNRAGFTEMLSSRVACFADQVYPILALANYGRRFHDSQSSNTAVAVAETICRLQGPMGQWWWHYDVQTGKVAEEYPVFSVHQHGMAPMALLAVDETANTDHTKYIEAGLMWLTGRNELNLKMMQPIQGMVWRDIHRREVGKVFRFVRGSLSLAGLNRVHRLMGGRWFGHVVNTECRPYELGWILYAWAGELARIPNKRRV